MLELGRIVDENRVLIVRRVALAVDQAVVTSTPVDTGRARSNWQVGLSSPVTSVRGSYVEGEGGSTAAANTQSAIEAARLRLTSYRGDPGGVYISNSLPYTSRLNEGSSAQAPAGFVETAIQVGNNAVRGSTVLRRS